MPQEEQVLQGELGLLVGLGPLEVLVVQVALEVLVVQEQQV